jgi:hypothetical protein
MIAVPGSGGTRRRALAAAAIGLAIAIAAAACSSSPSGTSTTPAKSSASDIAAALQKKSAITVWAWAPQVKDIVAAFEKKYPNVTVNLVNAGTATDEYTKLQNAVKAGSGAPDVAQIEYYALSQFALTGSLANLGDLGLDSLKSDYAPAVWGAVTPGGQLVGLPQDTGPMALFYNQKIFAKYGLNVPATWADYLADAKKLHAANAKDYLTNDTGDPGFITSMIWDAGIRTRSAAPRTSQLTCRTPARRSSPRCGTRWSGAGCSRRSPHGPPSGTRPWATARSPVWSPARGCPATWSPVSRPPRETGGSRRCRSGSPAGRPPPRKTADRPTW